jgi:hypothetical protein
VVNPDAEVMVFEENWPALLLFSALGTQWRMGMAGATGLDYAALAAVMDLHEIAPAQRRERFDEIRTMERAALDAMARNRKK